MKDILTDAQRKAFKKGMTSCAETLAAIKWLETVASAAPEFENLAKELRQQHDHLELLCRTAIDAEQRIMLELTGE
jgi:hypothetical protein